MTNHTPWDIAKDWPTPHPDALALSTQLVGVIKKSIGDSSISFARFMQLALYAPGLGYYSAGAKKFGAAGDFITAPEESPLFSRCVARSCQAILQEIGNGDILELGAGSGIMACDLLLELERVQSLPKHYYILEISADLRQRQQITLKQGAPHLLPRIKWLDQLPRQNFKGIILGNEVIDAMPVQRFLWRDQQISTEQVTWENGCFQSKMLALEDSDLKKSIQQIIQARDLPDNYCSEINPTLTAWINSLSEILQQGMMLFIDYGYPQSEYYHQQRDAGTLRCYYRHRAHNDPFILPGLQDITAHVDFSAVAAAGDKNGLHITGYTTQAHFLIDTDIESFMLEIDPTDEKPFLQQAQKVRKLMMPGEMGERFRCIAMTRDIEQETPGFRIQDMRNRL